MTDLVYNYHTHTYRCGHATGTEEEYIVSAIDAGIKHMGFSDHIPFVSSCGREAKYRVPASQGYDYCSDIKKLAERYRDQIDIKIGFESEYYRDNFREMLKNAVEYGAEYLILGQHFVKDELTGGVHTYMPTEDIGYVEDYAESVVEAIKTGAFSYVAHPDIINYFEDAEKYCGLMRRICVQSRESRIPLEINFLGIRESRIYPRDEFWKIAGEEGSPVTFGFDAHDPSAAGDTESSEKAFDLVKQYGLNYIGKPDIIDIRRMV